MTLQQQLPLGFSLRDDATFTNFLPGHNAQVLHVLLEMVQGKGDNYVYVWGPQSSGRSHLLQASCHAAPEFSQAAVYIPLATADTLDLDVFVGLEHINLICLDDIEQIAGNQYWEEQIFHLFNRVRANNKRLIITANVPPTALTIKLPDLKSRLAWGTVYQLAALSDEQKLSALQLRAQRRGLDLDLAVGKFLLRRCPRDMRQLFSTLEQLDQASFAEQRRLTIPFVKDVLGV